MASGSRPSERAGQRARAVRRHRGALVEVGDPVDVAQQRMGVRQQVMGQQHRLRGLQVGLAGHDRGRVRGGLGRPARRPRRSTPSADSARWRRAATSGTAWPPGRCGTGRRAAGRPGRRRPGRSARAPARRARPRRWAAGRSCRRRRPSPRLSSPASRPSRCSSVSSPARCSTRACAFDAGDVVRRQHPVEVRRLAQRGKRVGRAAGEPPAPQRALVGATGAH